jgi:hypothetical protein
MHVTLTKIALSRHQVGQILQRDVVQERIDSRQQKLPQKVTYLTFKVEQQRGDEVLCSFVDNSTQITASQNALNIQLENVHNVMFGQLDVHHKFLKGMMCFA